MREKRDGSAGNAALIGLANGRRRLATPALIVDADRLEANIAAVAAICRDAGIGLRPHAKGHKCPELACRQLKAGAVGLCCTTLAEAELMAGAGIPGILLTSEVVGEANIRRLLALADRARELIAVVDAPEAVAGIGRAAAASGRSLPLLVDVDVGQRRTGVPAGDLERLGGLAAAIASTPGVEFAGLQAYYGHLQGVSSFAEREARIRAGHRQIAACVAHLTAAGLPPRIVSGGGTGTLLVDAGPGTPFTELQPGSYPFLDCQYGRVELTADDTRYLSNALFVRGEVVSALQPDRVTVNVGMKAISTDGGPPVLSAPRGLAAEYQFAGDEHGFLFPAEGQVRLKPGDPVELIPSHCDTTVNLHAALHVVRGDALEAVWEIGARGVW